MQLGSFIIRKEGGDIGIVTQITDSTIRFVVVKGRWAYETGDKSWMSIQVFRNRWELMGE